jgi:hypothetical protein
LLRFASVLLPRRISWLAVCLGLLAGIRGDERLHLVAPSRRASRGTVSLPDNVDVGLFHRTMDVPPESELLVAARQGDPAAFERLVSRHRRELYAHGAKSSTPHPVR